MQAAHWKYLNEGNASLVFAYVGPPSNTYSQKALRIRKQKLATNPAFAHAIISSLLGDEFAMEDTLVPVPAHFLLCLQTQSQHCRPPARAVSTIDLTQTTATLMHNLVSALSMTVEIKPKWAFIPQNYKNCCRFCSLFYIRKGSKCSYCLLDLHSANKDRIQNCLIEMLNTSSLRVFDSGSMNYEGKKVFTTYNRSMNHSKNSLATHEHWPKLLHTYYIPAQSFLG